MPNRQKVNLIDIANRENLTQAAFLAAKGKRFRGGVRRYLLDLDDHLNDLSETILAETYTPEPLREFIVHDPKQRTIHAPAFCDRVLHHAVILQIGPHIDRTLIDDCFACRVGKGAIAAVLRTQQNSRRFPWFCKVDISKYFHSIDHDLLRQRLIRRFKGNAFLNLLDRIVRGFHTTPGKGLPIGALTSQYFANLYLNDADRWLIARDEVQGFVRYMDDMICWCDSNTAARDVLSGLERFLAEHLSLTLKPGSQINRTDCGISFCGHRIFPGIIRLTKRRQKLYRMACRRWERRFLRGEISANTLQNGYASAYSLTKHADALEWRRQRLGQHVVEEV